MEHIEKSPFVRLRVEDKIYPAQATRVTNRKELANFASVWSSLWVFQRDPLQFEEAWLYRVEPR